MSTLHKVKAYFGMAPMEDYDDEYYDDDDRAPVRAATSAAASASTTGTTAATTAATTTMRAANTTSRRRTTAAATAAATPTSPGSARANSSGRHRGSGALRGSTRGALAMDPRRMAMLFEEGSPLSKITTLRPKDYSEARTIGERFRDGTPVIMDLVSMDNADAKRLVDFAAGLAFALRGSFDKVATKVFLLSPADVDVTPEERRRIAETGFYAYQ